MAETETLLVKRYKSVISKCEEAKTVIEAALKQADADESAMVVLAKTHTHLQMLLEAQRQVKRLLADFERVQGKVEFVMDSVVLLQQLQSKEGGQK